MTTKARIEWTPEVTKAVVAANRSGLTQSQIADILGVSCNIVQTRCAAGGARTGGRNGSTPRGPDADIHIAVLTRIAANKTQIVARPSRREADPPSQPAVPIVRPCDPAPSLAAKLGIRVHTNGNGISLPYLSSLYGGAHHG